MPFGLKLNTAVALCSAIAVGSIISGSAQAASYSAAADFSIASNPNGVWSYLYNNTLLPLGQSTSTYQYWWNGGAPVTDSAIVGRATSAPTSSGTVQFGTNYLTMDPEGQTVDVRFTAPSAGTYLITGEFFGADNQTNCNPCATHPVLITDSASGTIFGPDTISTYLQTYTFSLTETLNSWRNCRLPRPNRNGRKLPLLQSQYRSRSDNIVHSVTCRAAALRYRLRCIRVARLAP